MKFAEPLWLLAALAACGALLLTWWRYDFRQRAALGTLAAAHLRAQLTASVSTARRRWKRAFLLASVAFLFVALARPQAGFRWEEVKRRGIEIVFAVDTSRSMLTPDVKPNRLTRAKLAVDDFVNHLDGDGVGLVAFAGNAFLQCPITLDYDAFHESLAALDTKVIPRGGTDIASAIQETQAALQGRSGSDKLLVLMTDGEDLEGNALDAAKTAAKDGLKIFTIGVGTPGGDLIPVPTEQGGGFVKDNAGQAVRSRLDEPALKAIAAATRGLYAPLGSQGQGLEAIYQKALAPLAKHDLTTRRQRVYTERFQWPLAAALGCVLASLLVGSRRASVRKRAARPAAARPHLAPLGATALLAASLFLPPAPVNASSATAEAAYQKGDFTAAEHDYAAAAQHDPNLTALQFNAAAAAYRAGQFAQATEGFQKSLAASPSADPKQLGTQEDAYYDLGNTLYRTGQSTEKSDPKQTIQNWGEAVKNYDAALQLHPDDSDSKYNRDFVQRKLDQLKRQQKDQQQKDQNNQKQDQKESGQQKPSGQNSEQKNPQSQNQKQDQQKQSRQTSPKNSQTADRQSGAGSKADQQNHQKPDQQRDSKNEGAKNSAAKNPADENNQAGAAKPDQKEEQQQANNGVKADLKESAPHNGGQPQPANAQPKNGSAKSGAEEKKEETAQQDPEPQTPGQMTKEEARNLLDSLKDETRRLPTPAVARSGTANPQDQPIKDW